jgi:TonB family protein
VRLRVVVGPDGRVKEASVISGHPLLTQAAIDAVNRWRYEPTLLNGEPMEITTEAVVDFPLGEPNPEPPTTNAAPPSPPAAAPQQPLPPRYNGPASGTLTWSGRLQKNTPVVFDGNQASQGSLTGALPGVPVIVEIETKDVGIAEAPGPSNGWKRLSLRSKKDLNSVVVIRWRRL